MRRKSKWVLRAFTAVVTNLGGKVVFRCDHKHVRAINARHCAYKNRPENDYRLGQVTEVHVEASDGRPVTVSDFQKTARHRPEYIKVATA